MSAGTIRDDFAGPGGWDVALAGLDLPSTGVEFEATAVATARAAGHTRLHADVRALRDHPWGDLAGYVSSPPCQTFSMAGKGAGRSALDALLLAVDLVAGGLSPEAAIAEVHSDELDDRSVLVLEPLLVVRDHRPQWVAFEQVPPVLPVWVAIAQHLTRWGYHVDTGCLQAEQYGVPQTRRRAVLVANQDHSVRLPVPTHSRYYSREPARLDPGVLPWVSMAEALGWSATERVGFPRLSDTDSNKSGGDVVTLDGTDYRARDLFDAGRHAPHVTGKARSWSRWELRNGPQQNAAVRSLDEPAGTVYSQRTANLTWEPVPATDSGSTAWVHDRPSPTIVGSFAPDVVAAPGYRKPGDPPRQRTPGSVRVTVQEAAVLQTFPADYPWQGSMTAQFQQVGNAVPPGLARAVLLAAMHPAVDPGTLF